jgi:hypothetical protein
VNLLKKGPKFGPSLTDEQRLALVRYLNDNNESVTMVSRKIGVSYNQLYLPMSGRNNCSRKSHKKILRFIELHCSKEVV